jgi:hypothetical protein
MKFALVLPALAVCACLVQAGSEDAEKAVGNWRKAVQDLTAVLKTVKDKTSAEAAVTKVDGAAKRLKETDDACKKVDANAMLAAISKNSAGITADFEAFKSEMNRVMNRSEWADVLSKSAEWKAVTKKERDAKAEVAVTEVRVLEKALQAYKLKNGNYPAALKDLVDAKFVEKGPLNDPWGRPYQYDASVVHPDTGVPRIFSTGPDPKDKNGVIANWYK